MVFGCAQLELIYQEGFNLDSSDSKIVVELSEGSKQDWRCTIAAAVALSAWGN
jgi:hypothetical protein